MEFRVLGLLEVGDNGRPVTIGRGKESALLALLLVNANQPLSIDRLIDELWEKRPPENAAKTIQIYISRLRGRLGRERIVTTPAGYMLRAEPAELDASRFEQLATEGRNQLEAGNLGRAEVVLSQALDLWRGEALADFRFDAFAQTAISRLQDLHGSAVADRVDARLALGRAEELITELETLVRGQPLWERPRRQLMLALYQAGRQADALELYQSTRRLLTQELGLDPSPELQALERAILNQAPEVAKPPRMLDPSRAPAEMAETPRGGFVGRETELEELLTGLEDALAGQGRLFLLVGEAGIGKSRLAEETAARASAAGARVLWGRCWEAGGAPAYWPWVQSLRSYVADCDPAQLRGQVRGNAAHVAQLVPEIAELLPDFGEPSPLDGDGARFQLFDATATFIARASAQQPLVLVLDDLQAADEPSLLLLRFVARNVRDARLLIIGAYREDEVHADMALSESLSDLARHGRRLSLAGLTAQDVGSFIELVSGARPTEAIVSALHEESDGNPLFIGELVQLAAAKGELGYDRQVLNKGAVPSGIRDVIGRRLKHLSPECRRLLEGGSIFGREFRLDALSRLLELDQAVLLNAVDEAIAGRIVAELPGTPARLRFAHGLIRDTVYGELGGAQRVLLHRRTGEVLAGLYSRDQESHLAELAHHFLSGHEVDRGADYARRAGDQALRLLAYEEAVRLYEAALEALESSEPESGQTRCELMLALGEAQARAGDMPKARQTFVGAAELARNLGDAEYLARAALGYGGRFVWLRAGSDRVIIPLLEDALAALPIEDSSLRVRVLARLAGALRDLPSPKRRVDLCSEAVAMARRHGDPATLAYALDGMSALAAPDAVGWFELATELVTVAQMADDRERMFNGRTSRAGAAMALGDISTADADIEAMAKLADELRQRAQLWMTTVFLAMRALFDGRNEEGEKLIAEAQSHGQTAEAWDAGTVFQIQLYALRREQSRLDELDEMIRPTVLELPARPLFRCMLADIHVARGRTTEAREMFEALAAQDFGLIPTDTEWATSISILAETCAFLGDAPRAEKLYDLLLPYADKNVFNHPELSRGAVARYLGLLSTTAGRWANAEAHFDQALEMNTRMGARPWLAWTQHDYSRMLIASGNAGGRAAHFSAAAAATADELGMARLSSEISAS